MTDDMCTCIRTYMCTYIHVGRHAILQDVTHDVLRGDVVTGGEVGRATDR